MHHTDVVVVGSANADLLLSVPRHPRPGETVLGAGGDIRPGGKGANQAVAAALQGAATALVGAVGDDAYAAAATSGLLAAGVDLTGLSRVHGTTGLAVVTVQADGENTIVVVPGANAAVTAESVRAEAPRIRRARVCVLQGELPVEATGAAISIAAEAGVRLMLNLAPVVDLPFDAIRLSDPLVVNEHEAMEVLASLRFARPGRPGDLAARDADRDADVAAGMAAAAALQQGGIPSVVVTLGPGGAAVAHSEGVVHVPAPSVKAVDTTGAGDAFVGALAAALASGVDLVGAATRAVRVAAFAVTRAGAQPSYPGPDDALPR